ncbi:MAG TPA: oxygen-insensitive NAD(P)H nitroreductase [Spirochaetota bacterium]|nr:oxygen-insensitive NAD(P)H nitroreductase [Spirochaetota bacterium]HPJ33463.1 oxygen-insensitive NAD(P)H nitroreductase [Spirochaetota bacterium]
MTLTELVKQRYTTKVFDPSFRLTGEQVGEIKTLLRYTPSSTNSQPWYFIIAGTDEGKEKIAGAATGRYEANAPKIRNASHVVVLCSRSSVDNTYLDSLLANEEREGRFPDGEAKKNQAAVRAFYSGMHRFELKDLQHWTEKQVYIALGTLLMGAAMLGIDACPMEGFDAAALNRELNLREKGFTASLIVALGRHADSDFNKNLPKSRLPEDMVISEI